MLTVNMRQVVEQSSGRMFVAQVIRIPSNAAAGAHIYHLGITLEDGMPLGLMTTANGEVLRKWRRFSPIEDYLAIMPERLISITLYPMTCPLPTVVNMLINRYHLDQELKTAPLESERTRLIDALRSPKGENDPTRDSSERSMGRYLH
ncbi:hypothetical protein [uncultured Tateyamaria sp.]|uniref:hypothetical protein n=1 Tax=uncultured Tateyamaria sp. TaxID=455651 RepID=UPI00260D93AB|nr:hypothetical protein [uncultured Tateyamaria sp.]